MKHINPNILNYQAENIRKPSTEIRVADPMLHWTAIKESIDVTPPYWVSHHKTYGGEDAALIDGIENDSGEIVYYVWRADANPGENSFRTATYDPAAGTWSNAGISGVTDCPVQRISAHPNITDDFAYVDDSNIIHFDGDTFSAPVADEYALAVTYNSLFIATLREERYPSAYTNVPSGTGGQILRIYVFRSDEASPRDARVIHEQQVSEDYSVARLSWFDAVSMNGTYDLVLFNAHAYGKPMLMKVHRSYWDADDDEIRSDPYPLVPIDVVNNYSFVRLGWLKRIEDTYIATGIVGREGSTGAHPQQWDAAMRSKDGIHWTVTDRLSYMGNLDMRSPMVYDGSHTFYKIDGDHLYSAEATVPFGLDAPATEITISDDDIKTWSVQVQKDSIGANTSLRPLGRKYIDDALSTYIGPGYTLRRYAGYNDTKSLFSTETVDIVQNKLDGERGRSVALVSRGWARRLLDDWASDQDWQWLSQSVVSDDCDDLGHLYSMNGEVPDDDADGYLEFSGLNDPNIMFTSTPTPEDDFYVASVFSIRNDLLLDDANAGTDAMLGTRESGESESDYKTWTEFESAANTEANDFVYPETLLGTGFGVLGCGVDQYNFIAAFADVGNNKLYLLQRDGDEDSNDWYFLAEDSFTTTPSTASVMDQETEYEVWVKREGIDFTYGINQFTSEGKEEFVTEQYFNYDHTYELEGDNVGVITNLRVPEARVWYVEEKADYIARAVRNWDIDVIAENTDLTQYERFFEFAEGDRVWIDDEEMEIVSTTESNYASTRTFVEAAVMQEANETRWRGFIDWTTYTRLIIEGNKGVASERNDTRIEPWYTTYGGTSMGSRPHLGWLFVPSRQRGVGEVGWIEDMEFDTETPFTEDPDNEADIERLFVATFSPFATLTESSTWSIDIRAHHDLNGDELDPGKDQTVFEVGTWYHILPGFKVKNADGNPRSEDPGDSHSKHSMMYAHENDVIRLHHFQAYDSEHDKNADWVLKDLAAKAGVLDFSGAFQTFDTDQVGTRVTETDQAVETYSLASGRVKNFDVIYKLFTRGMFPNAGFDSDLTGWIFTGTGTAAWDSGSVRLTHDQGSFSYYSGVTGALLEHGTVVAEVWGNLGAETDGEGNIQADHLVEAEVWLEWIDDTEVVDEKLVGYIHGTDQHFVTRTFSTVSEGIHPVRLDVSGLRLRIDHDVGSEQLDYDTYVEIAYANLFMTDGDSGVAAEEFYETCAHFSLSTKLEFDNTDEIQVELKKDADGLSLVSSQHLSGEVGSFDIDTYELPYEYSWPSEVRFVKHGEFIAVYLDDKWVRTVAFYSPTGDSSDQFPDLDRKGTIKGTLTSDHLHTTAVVRELNRRVDGEILDQQMSATQGIDRILRDQRVKFNETTDGRLLISKYVRRPSVGRVGNTVRSDAKSPTDRVPTHVRVVGEEIGEYFDHAAAEDYGLVFYLSSTPSLDEDEAYNEAEKIIQEAISYAKAHRVTLGAYLNWMPEDRALLAYDAYDSDETVLVDVIVDSINIAYGLGTLGAQATLRELYDENTDGSSPSHPWGIA